MAAFAVNFGAVLSAVEQVKDIAISYSLSLRTTYIESDPLAVAIIICCVTSYACYLISSQSGNYSMVDRLWSIMPIVYTWHFVLSGYMADRKAYIDERMLLIATITTCWGCRLTYNFWRRGGYEPTHEDYRWPLIRKRLKYRWLLDVFNVVFISVFQHALLLLISAPGYVAWRARHTTPVSVYDYGIAGMVLLLLVIEFLADQQMYNFQEEKYRRINSGIKRSGDYARGFITSGLWRYCRHPNFFAEQAIWCTMYLFSVSASGVWLNWTLVGPVLLILLFQGSTTYTESITKDKYPDYAQYQESTSRLIPWFPGNPLDDPGIVVDDASGSCGGENEKRGKEPDDVTGAEEDTTSTSRYNLRSRRN